MRGIWKLAIGAFVLVAVLVVTGFLVLEEGGRQSSEPPTRRLRSASSYGNANVTAKATGKSYHRTVIVRAKTKQSGAPICGAGVSVAGQMTAPHTMILIPRNLHEVSCGLYEGPYDLIMAGDWTLNFQVRSKELGAHDLRAARSKSVPEACCYPRSRPQSRPCAVLPAARLDSGLSSKEVV